MKKRQFGGNLVNHKSEKSLGGLSGASFLGCVCTTPGLEPQLWVSLALPRRTPRAWHTACLLVVALTAGPAQ